MLTDSWEPGRWIHTDLACGSCCCCTQPETYTLWLASFRQMSSSEPGLIHHRQGCVKKDANREAADVTDAFTSLFFFRPFSISLFFYTNHCSVSGVHTVCLLWNCCHCSLSSDCTQTADPQFTSLKYGFKRDDEEKHSQGFFADKHALHWNIRKSSRTEWWKCISSGCRHRIIHQIWGLSEVVN